MDREQIRKILQDIHNQVPESLRKAVVIHEKATPTIEMVMEKATTMESIPQEKRDNIKKLLEAGEFSQIRARENPKVAKQIDQFVTRAINRAIKEGRLPNKKKLKEIMENDERNRKTTTNN